MYDKLKEKMRDIILFDDSYKTEFFMISFYKGLLHQEGAVFNIDQRKLYKDGEVGIIDDECSTVNVYYDDFLFQYVIDIYSPDKNKSCKIKLSDDNDYYIDMIRVEEKDNKKLEYTINDYDCYKKNDDKFINVIVFMNGENHNPIIKITTSDTALEIDKYYLKKISLDSKTDIYGNPIYDSSESKINLTETKVILSDMPQTPFETSVQKTYENSSDYLEDIEYDKNGEVIKYSNIAGLRMEDTAEYNGENAIHCKKYYYNDKLIWFNIVKTLENGNIINMEPFNASRTSINYPISLPGDVNIEYWNINSNKFNENDEDGLFENYCQTENGFSFKFDNSLFEFELVNGILHVNGVKIINTSDSFTVLDENNNQISNTKTTLSMISKYCAHTNKSGIGYCTVFKSTDKGIQIYSYNDNDISVIFDKDCKVEKFESLTKDSEKIYLRDNFGVPYLYIGKEV